MGFVCFVAFETAAFQLLRFLTSGPGRGRPVPTRKHHCQQLGQDDGLHRAAPGAGDWGGAGAQQPLAPPLPRPGHGLVLCELADEFFPAFSALLTQVHPDSPKTSRKPLGARRVAFK
ncbi:MAG: hypothetical protein WKG07_45010 [Hymenobacter sp.]